MAKVMMKKPSFHSLPSKKGKSRMIKRPSRSVRAVTKRPASMKKSKIPYVPYVRHGTPSFRVRGDRSNWSISLKKLHTMSEKQVVDALQKVGILKQWCGKTCPRCAKGVMKKRSYDWYQCSNYKCTTRWLAVHSFHPIFAVGKVQSFSSIRAALILTQP